MHNFISTLALYSCTKFSDLTFEGPLADTTPVLPFKVFLFCVV